MWTVPNTAITPKQVVRLLKIQAYIKLLIDIFSDMG